ncbi:MAG: TonB-dependent receptor [Gemmatimonadota bacterium]
MRRLMVSFLAIALFAGSSTALLAQDRYVVQGTVTGTDGLARGGTAILVEGTNAGGLARSDGTYRFELRASGQVTVNATLIGHSSASEVVTLGDEEVITVNFTLGIDPLGLDELVVTGVSNPASKLESSVSITTIDPGLLEVSAPRTTAEIFRTIPGIRSEASGGDGNTNITVRGVPISAGGSKYLQLQEDGLPIFLFGDIAFATADIFLRADANLDHIEAIRGGSASTLASNSPAGIINFVSKTGALAGGSIGTTVGLDYNSTRFDFNYGGPVGESMNFHLGGFVRNGEGPRQAGFTAARGGQIKANLTRNFDTGLVRIYLKYLDDRTPAYMPGPIQVTGTNENPDWESVAGFDAQGDGLQSVFLQSNFGLDGSGGRRVSDVSDGMRALSKTIGAEVSFDFGDGWNVQSRARIASNSGRFLAPFSAAVGTPADILAAVDGAIDPDLTGATLSISHTGDPFSGNLLQVITLFDTELEDFDNTITDTRISKTQDNVTFTGGLFKGVQRIKMSWLWNQYLTEVRGDNAALVDITDASGTKISETGQIGFGVPFWGNCCQVQYNSSFDVTAPYAELSIAASPTVNFDASVRVDIVDVRGVGAGGVQGEVDINNDGDISPIEESVSSIDQSQRNPVDYDFDYASYSAGLNVMLNDNQAVFGRFSHGASAKADRAIFPTGTYVDPIQFGPKDEIDQAEIGLKQQFSNGGLFLTGFYASTTEEGGFEATTQAVIENDYQAFGAELEASFVFDAVDFRGAVTWTDAEITSGDNDGNTPRRQPSLMYNLIPTVGFGDEGQHRFGVSLIGQTKTYAQDSNELVMPAYNIVNAFLSVGITEGLHVSVGANNLFDTIGITESEEGSITENQVNFVRARSITGRSLTASLGYSF